MDTKTGGPAFPSESDFKYFHGMTMRDYFAAKAMREVDWADNTISAVECYAMADAMLKARSA